MGYALQWEPLGVVARYFDHVSGDDLIAHIVEIERDERFDQLRFVINDFLAAESVTSTSGDIEEMASRDIGAARTNPRIKLAIVVARPEVVHQACQYIRAADGAYPTRIFPTMAEARAWVGMPLTG